MTVDEIVTRRAIISEEINLKMARIRELLRTAEIINGAGRTVMNTANLIEEMKERERLDNEIAILRREDIELQAMPTTS
jgi:hypothetical protein